MAKLVSKVAVITGGNRGIGKGIALGLGLEGAALVIVGRDKQSLEKTRAEFVARCFQVLPIVADVTDEAQVQGVFSKALGQFGHVDILVNSAGAFDGGPIDELSLEAWDKVMAVNLRAPFLCTREAFRIMKKQGGGRIINVGSIAAQRVRPYSASYSASKHGLWGLTQVTALEGREFGITCGCLHPGNTLVERRQGSGKTEDDEPMMSVGDLAQTAVLMATLPANVNLLEAIVLPAGQQYIGRG